MIVLFAIFLKMMFGIMLVQKIVVLIFGMLQMMNVIGNVIFGITKMNVKVMIAYGMIITFNVLTGQIIPSVQKYMMKHII